MHAGAAAGPGNNDQRQLLLRGTFDGAGELFADHGAHAAHDEGRIGHAEGHAPAADHARPHHRRLAQPGAALLFLEPLRDREFCPRIPADRPIAGRRPIPRTSLRRAPGRFAAGRGHTNDSRTRGKRRAASPPPCGKIVPWQPGQRFQSPSGTPRLGCFNTFFQLLGSAVLADIGALARGGLSRLIFAVSRYNRVMRWRRGFPRAPPRIPRNALGHWEPSTDRPIRRGE